MGARVPALVADERQASLARGDVRARIDLALERIRPAIQMDGGDIHFVAYEEGVLRVALSGACTGCHASSTTMTMGVERVMRSLVPEVSAVEAV